MKADRLRAVLKNQIQLSKRIKAPDGKDLGPLSDHIAMVTPDDVRLKDPELELDDLYYMHIFKQISKCRAWEQGYPYPIPLSAFADYCTLFKDELFIDEILLLQTLDDEYVISVIENIKAS